MKRDLNSSDIYILYHRFKNLLPGGVPLNQISDNCAPFFIIGSGRCGTTLLRELLNLHSSVVIPPESYSLPMIYKKHKIYRSLPWHDYLKIILGEFENHSEFNTWGIDLTECKLNLALLDRQGQSLRRIIKDIYLSYAAKKGKANVLWGDKSVVNTLYLDHLDKIFLKTKYIHIIRDGFDVVASYLNSKLVNNLEEAAEKWNSAINYCAQYKKTKPSHIFEIRYEDLVRHPKIQLQKVCKFLEIEFEPALINNKIEFKSGDLIHKHHNSLQDQIHTNSIGRWKSFFTEPEKNKLNTLLEHNRHRHHYL